MEDLHCWQSKFKNCYYAERLIRKIKLLNKRSNYKVDLIQIKKAIYYAKKYHYGQKRNSGEPYYTHPLCVAEMVADHVFKTDILVTSILHDTIEDTYLTKDMVEFIFDTNISKKVDHLTRIKVDRKISSAEMMELLWLEKKKDLLLIKYFDRLHNIKTISAKPEPKQKKIIQETLETFLPIAAYLGMLNKPENIIKHWINNVTGKPHINLPVFSFQDSYQPLSPALQNEIIQKYIHKVLES